MRNFAAHFSDIDAALQAKKAAGARLGNPVNLNAAGSLGRAIQSSAAERFVASVVPQLSAIPRSGASSLAEIADALNERGVQSAKGGPWHRSAVRNLLARAKSLRSPSVL